MVQPGSIGSIMPPSEDSQVRRVADLERFVRELGPSVAASFASTVADLRAAQAELAAQQAYQASLVTKAVVGADFDVFNIPGDQVYRYTDTGTFVTAFVPTGSALITVGCSVMRMDTGESTGEGLLTYSIEREGSPTYVASNAVGAKAYRNGGNLGGSAVSAGNVHPITGDGLERTFRLHYGTWSASTTTLATLRVVRPYIQVQVIPAAIV